VTLAVAASAIAAAVDVAYVWIIWVQGGPTHLDRVAYVAAFIAAGAAAAALGASRAAPGRRLPPLGAATGGLLSAGAIGIFSIGLPLLVAGTLASIAWARGSSVTGPDARHERLVAALAAVAAPFVLVAGVALTG
jgi:hypothetical protein